MSFGIREGVIKKKLGKFLLDGTHHNPPSPSQSSSFWLKPSSNQSGISQQSESTQRTLREHSKSTHGALIEHSGGNQIEIKEQ